MPVVPRHRGRRVGGHARSARLDRRIPAALIGLVASTALAAALDLQSHGVAVLGTVHTGAPHLGLTGLSWSALGACRAGRVVAWWS